MKILLSNFRFSELTGSELYFYELSRELLSLGHEVHLVANAVGGEIATRAGKNGLLMHTFDRYPDTRFDIVHASQLQPGTICASKLNGAKLILTVHSQLQYEIPYVGPEVFKYICIRRPILDHVRTTFCREPEKSVVIYNGVDFSRFNQYGSVTPERRQVLFVGTVDPLRRGAIEHLVTLAKAGTFDLLVVGDKFQDYMDWYVGEYVRWEPSRWAIETCTKTCTETAGVYLGRTTIEGWACGKPGWIYDVRPDGRVVGVGLHQPPDAKLLKNFDSKTVASSVLAVYQEALQ